MVANNYRNSSTQFARTSPALQSNVLALNRLYSAVHVISAKRAFCLLWKRAAEVVHVENGSYLAYDFESWREVSEMKAELEGCNELDDWVCSVQFDVQVPRIVRLLNYDRVPQNYVRFSRRNVFLRDENRCQYCGVRFSQQKLSLDHVVPRSQGGPSTWENIVCACLQCNVRKGGRTPQEAGMKLRTVPKRPRRNPVLSFQISSRKYSCWKNFLD